MIAWSGLGLPIRSFSGWIAGADAMAMAIRRASPACLFRSSVVMATRARVPVTGYQPRWVMVSRVAVSGGLCHCWMAARRAWSPGHTGRYHAMMKAVMQASTQARAVSRPNLPAIDMVSVPVVWAGGFPAARKGRTGPRRANSFLPCSALSGGTRILYLIVA